MIFSAPYALDAAADLLPAALVDRRALARAREAAAALPDIVSSLCLECRLEEGAQRVDFIACVMAAEGGRRASRLPEQPGWGPVSEIFAAWSAEGSPLATQAPSLCLEIDLSVGVPAPEEPLVLACIQPAYRAPPVYLGDRAAPPDPPAPRLDVARRLLGLLGRRLSPAADRAMAVCFDALPPIGQMVHVGSLHSRGLDAVRLMGSMPGRDLPGYLDRVGWPGELAQVKELLSVLCPPESTIAFDLDVGEAVSPLLGVERYERGTAAPYASALDWLCEQGACTPEKRAGVLAWPGRRHTTLAGHGWPTIAHRMIEIKVVLHPGGPLRAKAYLGIEHGFSLLGG